MKKYILIFALILALVPSSLWAAVGTCTQSLASTFQDGTRAQKILTFTCVGGTAGETGTYPATAISSSNADQLQGYYLYKLITNPGATPPEDNWDFVLTDGDGIDVLGGAGANRHTTTSQMIAPLLTTGVYFAQPVLEAWTLAITGNTTASAIVVIKAVFVR
jgi:hypothetical protein